MLKYILYSVGVVDHNDPLTAGQLKGAVKNRLSATKISTTIEV